MGIITSPNLVDDFDYTLGLSSSPWKEIVSGPCFIDIGNTELNLATGGNSELKRDTLTSGLYVYEFTLDISGMVPSGVTLHFGPLNANHFPVINLNKFSDHELKGGGAFSSFGNWTSINIPTGNVEITLYIHPTNFTIRVVANGIDSGTVAIDSGIGSDIYVPRFFSFINGGSGNYAKVDVINYLVGLSAFPGEELPTTIPASANDIARFGHVTDDS